MSAYQHFKLGFISVVILMTASIAVQSSINRNWDRSSSVFLAVRTPPRSSNDVEVGLSNFVVVKNVNLGYNNLGLQQDDVDGPVYAAGIASAANVPTAVEVDLSSDGNSKLATDYGKDKSEGENKYKDVDEDESEDGDNDDEKDGNNDGDRDDDQGGDDDEDRDGDKEEDKDEGSDEYKYYTTSSTTPKTTSAPVTTTSTKAAVDASSAHITTTTPRPTSIPIDNPRPSYIGA